MPTDKVKYRDTDGFTFRHPERSCKLCLNYPCVTNMDKLRCDFAKYGCINFKSVNVFN